MKTILILAIALALTAFDTFAGSAAWKRNPVDGDWNNAANWVGDGPPNGPSDIATFNYSRLTDLFLSDSTTLDSLVFGHQAGTDWTVTVPSGIQLSFVGAGIDNGIFSYENFVSDATGGPGGGIIFSNSASCGGFDKFTNRGGTASGESGGFVKFLDNSHDSEGTASWVYNEGGTVAGAGGGFTELRGTANPNSTSFINRAGVVGASGGSTSVYDNASGGEMSADGATAAGAGPGSIHYYGNASGGAFTANGGSNGGDGGLIEIRDDSPGDFAEINVEGNGVFDLSNHNPAVPVTTRDIQGDGSIVLGGSNLIIGPLDLSFNYFDGVISDGGRGGSLTFSNSGIALMIFSGASTYTGGTTIEGSNLFILKNPNGSGTGRGPVNVHSGIFGGTGTIGGAVTVGDGSSAPAYITPGPEAVGPEGGGIGVLTIQKRVTFKSNGLYEFQISSKVRTSDKLNAKGVSIESGATIDSFDRSSQVSPPGTRYFAINNTGPSPIVGTFSNLPDGAIIVIGINTYQANYEGGDGNDLTLTVIP
jgi:autotransporter-associated beta strand protein